MIISAFLGNNMLNHATLIKSYLICMRFSQSKAFLPICGLSRISPHTGHYLRSNGSALNEPTPRIGRPGSGNHFHPPCEHWILVGKSHMVSGLEDIKR